MYLVYGFEFGVKDGGGHHVLQPVVMTRNIISGVRSHKEFIEFHKCAFDW